MRFYAFRDLSLVCYMFVQALSRPEYGIVCPRPVVTGPVGHKIKEVGVSDLSNVRILNKIAPPHVGDKVVCGDGHRQMNSIRAL